MTTSATSEHGGFIRGLANEIDAAGAPIDAAATRVIVNNLQHLCDQEGQFLVCFVPTTGEYLELGTPSTSEMTLVPAAEWDFPLRNRSGDESSFRVVVYFRGSISSAGTVTFRLALRVPDGFRATIPTDPATLAANHIAEVTTTSTTGADLTVTLYFPSTFTRPMTGRGSEDGSGDAMASYTHDAVLQVWAKSDNVARLPRIHALTAREYSGDR